MGVATSPEVNPVRNSGSFSLCFLFLFRFLFSDSFCVRSCAAGSLGAVCYRCVGDQFNCTTTIQFTLTPTPTPTPRPTARRSHVHSRKFKIVLIDVALV